MVIGPSFPDELKAAGLLGLPFSWGKDGSVTFGETMTDEQREQVLAVLAAHRGELSQAREERLKAINVETASRIATLFDKPPNSLALVWAEINALGSAVAALNTVREGGSLSAEEQARVEGLKDIWERISAIRAVGNTAVAAIEAAQTVDEVNGVAVEWPA
jgi:hypothetical protein